MAAIIPGHQEPAWQTPTTMFPPVCLRSHWDPEQIIRRTLPNQLVSVPLTPRPWTKVCMEYVTTAQHEDAPRPSDDVVFPSGGAVYPPTRYREAIDRESLLHRLDRPLGTCEREEYQPARSGDMFMPNATVPERKYANDRFIQELSFPMALMRSDVYDCRQEQDKVAMSRSTKLFNNATKTDRYATCAVPTTCFSK